MAILAAGMVIIPMHIIILVRGQTNSLAVVSPFVGLFGLELVIWPHIVNKRRELVEVFTPKEVLLYTIAYAGVLVVFVGTSS